MAGAVTPDRVMAEVERIMSRPFEWGPCDCCSASCDVFAALWGVDPMAPVRGYSGPLGAARMIRRVGGLPTLAETLAVRSSLTVGHATGGLALSAGHRERRALLICIMPGLWAGKSKDGFAILRHADRGWHLA